VGKQPEQRVTNPVARDPSGALMLVLICSWLLFAVAFVAGNVVVLCWAGFNLLVLQGLGLVDVLVVSGMGAASGKLNQIADTLRRQHNYVICAEDYAGAPRHIKATMQQIFLSAESLRTSRAHQEGMFGDVDIEHVLFSAAERAVQAEARASVENSTARAKSTTRIDTSDITDRVASVSTGYDEARKVSEDVLHGRGRGATDPPPSWTTAAWQAIQSAADWVTRARREEIT